MAIYSMTSFAGVKLPIYNVQVDAPVSVLSPIIRTVNGFYDVRGTRRQYPVPLQIRMQGVVASHDANSDSAYLIVNGGNRLVVNGGNPLLIVNQSPGQVRAQVEQYRALIGVLGPLIRTPFEGEPSIGHTISARLLAVREGGGRQYGPGLCAIDFEWEALDPFWKGEARSTSGFTLNANVGGNAPVRDATLTVTGTNANTRVTGPGIDFSYVSAGGTLTVNGWSASVAGVPVAVTLNSAHTADTLIELPAGGLTTILVTGASGASLQWNDKWV